MVRAIKIDEFSKNVVMVFLGTGLAGFLNLLYQLLLAHRLSPQDFAAFNSLLAIFVMLTAPLGTIATASAKYIAGFNAKNELVKIKFLINRLLIPLFGVALFSLVFFFLISPAITASLKIPSLSSAYIFSFLLASAIVSPVFTGALQGLERFNWYNIISIIPALFKIILAYIFIVSGAGISGALFAFLLSSVMGLAIAYLPLKNFFSLKSAESGVDLKEILLYTAPVAVSSFCFISLISVDMLLVKYFFTSEDAGTYALSQMLGKIFLFLPTAISIVSLPRASSLNKLKQDTAPVLKKSLFFGASLCVIAAGFYNLLPEFVLKILTGKAPLEAIRLGRFFSVSMSFYTLSYILIMYFISIADLRFLKYLVFSAFLEIALILVFHQNLFQIQYILCGISIMLFSSLYAITIVSYPRKRVSTRFPLEFTPCMDSHFRGNDTGRE